MPIDREATRTTELRGQLRALSPQGTLDRGYAIVQLPGGAVLRTPDEAPAGTRLAVTVAGGSLTAVAGAADPVGSRSAGSGSATQRAIRTTNRMDAMPTTEDKSLSTDSLSYEEARDELVRVVSELEQGSSTLEESIALWERGEALARRCEEWLIGAKARLEAARAGVESAARVGFRHCRIRIPGSP